MFADRQDAPTECFRCPSCGVEGKRGIRHACLPSRKVGSEPAATTERESREFFYVHDDGRVWKITGYICEGTPGYWWCPSVGVSAAEGFHLFRDRTDAYDRAHANALDAYSQAKANLERIEDERWA